MNPSWRLFPHPQPFSPREKGASCSPPERGDAWMGVPPGSGSMAHLDERASHRSASSTPRTGAAVASNRKLCTNREWCPESLVDPGTLSVRDGQKHTGLAAHTSSKAATERTRNGDRRRTDLSTEAMRTRRPAPAWQPAPLALLTALFASFRAMANTAGSGRRMPRLVSLDDPRARSAFPADRGGTTKLPRPDLELLAWMDAAAGLSQVARCSSPGRAKTSGARRNAHWVMNDPR